jgi:hypothetical protein
MSLITFFLTSVSFSEMRMIHERDNLQTLSEMLTFQIMLKLPSPESDQNSSDNDDRKKAYC